LLSRQQEKKAVKDPRFIKAREIGNINVLHANTCVNTDDTRFCGQDEERKAARFAREPRQCVAMRVKNITVAEACRAAAPV
jgi:hypothetical protein